MNEDYEPSIRRPAESEEHRTARFNAAADLMTDCEECGAPAVRLSVDPADGFTRASGTNHLPTCSELVAW